MKILFWLYEPKVILFGSWPKENCEYNLIPSMEYIENLGIMMNRIILKFFKESSIFLFYYSPWRILILFY